MNHLTNLRIAHSRSRVPKSRFFYFVCYLYFYAAPKFFCYQSCGKLNKQHFPLSIWWATVLFSFRSNMLFYIHLLFLLSFEWRNLNFSQCFELGCFIGCTQGDVFFIELRRWSISSSRSFPSGWIQARLRDSKPDKWKESNK